MRSIISISILSAAVAGSLLATGCAEYQYVYEPAVSARSIASGYPAAYYSIPAERPAGDLRVTTFGVANIQPQKDAAAVPAIHVRLIVANNSDLTPWTIDTRQILLSIGGVGRSRPAFANSDAGAPPLVQIAKGERRLVDLYYPLPPGVSNEDKLPSFDVLWKVNTGSGAIAQRTPFERQRVEGTYASGDYYDYYGYPRSSVDVSVGLGFGPYWWYDPYYPTFGFYHYPIIVGRVPYRVYGGPFYYRHGWHGGYRYGGYRPGPYRGGPYRGGPHRGYRR